MGKWTSEYTRGQVDALGMAGHSHRAIAALLGIPRSTVGDLTRRADAAAGESSPTLGRPVLTTARERRVILRHVASHPYASYSDVVEVLDLNCSPRTVNKIANEDGIHSYDEVRKGKLRAEELEARKGWSLSMTPKPLTYWTGNGGQAGGIHFTMDGKQFGKALDPEAALHGMGGKVKRRKGQGLHPAHLTGGVGVSTEKHHVKFFVGIGNGRATLCEEYVGKMSAAKMEPIIRKLPDAIRAAWGHGPPGRWLVSQDNDRSQNAFALKQVYARLRIDLDEWPPSSGDLRWIENCWPAMNRRIQEGDPGPNESRVDFVKRARRTILATAASDIWPHVQTMPQRLAKCITNGGGRVPY